MFQIYVILFTLIAILSFNFISKKKEFLVDKKFTPHKSFAMKELLPITGGLVFLLGSLVFLSFENNLIKLFILIIFIIGFLSDKNYLFSPVKRFFLQLIVIFLFVYFCQNFVNSLRLPIIDILLSNVYFKYFLTIFCIMVLINGSNFIDGVNTLLLGYYLGVSIISLIVLNKFGSELNIINLQVIIILLFLLFLFNFFNKLLSGDGGAYTISFLIGYYLIYISNLSEAISPFFVACLLWYPSYECLFSIVRKKLKKVSISHSDNKHLHQLILIYFRKKFDITDAKLNTITGLSINFFNYIIFYNALNNISQTKNLVLIILICLLIYSFVYYYLNKTIKSL